MFAVYPGNLNSQTFTGPSNTGIKLFFICDLHHHRTVNVFIQFNHIANRQVEQVLQREVGIANIDQWQIFFFRKDAWSNPLSSAEAAGDGKTDLPDGIRLVLTLSDGQAISGTLTRDWLRPGVGGGK